MSTNNRKDSDSSPRISPESTLQRAWIDALADSCSTQQAAAQLQVNHATILRRVRAGSILGARVGGTTIIHKPSLAPQSESGPAPL